MPRQRDIREKALLSLFSLSSAESTSLSDDSLWNLVLEPEDLAIHKISLKALKHQLQSFDKWTTQFLELSPKIAALLKTYEEKQLARQLLSLAKEIKLLAEKVSIVSSKSSAHEIQSLYSYAIPVKHTLASFKQGLTLSDYTSPEKEVFEQTLAQVANLLERIEYVSHPLENKEQGSITSLIKAAAEREELQEKACLLAQGTLDHLNSLDEKINGQLEHFSVDQIGKVEKSILRLAIYELHVLEHPKGVAINEALELAKKYATSEAVPLLNGVLDKV